MKKQAQNTECTQPAQPSIYFGFDLSDLTFTDSWRRVGLPPVQLEDIRKMATRDFERTRDGVKQWWETVSQTLSPEEVAGIVMEVTSSYSLEMLVWLKEVCPAAVVSVVPGLRVSSWGKSLGIQNKTDPIDARVLACFGAERQPPPTAPKDKQNDLVSWLLRGRLGFVEYRTALVQRLAEAKRAHLPPEAAKRLQQSIGKVLKTTQLEIEKLEKEVRKLIAQDKKLQADVELLQTIHGVGWFTAATIVAEFGDLSRFARRGEAVAAAGLNPLVRKSGTSVVKRPRISKQGNGYVRRALFLATMASIKGDNMFSRMHAELVERGKKKIVALVAVMRKMLTVMRAMVISGQAFDAYHESSQRPAVGKARMPVEKSVSECGLLEANSRE